MNDILRRVTEREIYDEHFGALHKICMEIAINEAKEMAEKYSLPITAFDISALTYQHYRMYLDKNIFIQQEKEKKQKQLDALLAKK